MSLLEQIVARAKADKQRIVLPEAEEERTLKAADKVLADDLADLILIGGGISREGEYLIGPIREKLPRHTFAGEVAPLPALAAAALGNDAGIIGAACLD